MALPGTLFSLTDCVVFAKFVDDFKARTGARLLVAMSALTGIGAFVLPLTTPWFLLVVFVAAALFVVNAPAGRGRLAAGTTAFIAVGLTVSGTVSAPLTAAVLSAAALAPTHLSLALTVLALQASSVATAEQLAQNLLAPFGLEAAAPALIALAGFLLAAPRRFHVVLAGAGLALAIGFAALPPLKAASACAAPALCAAVVVAWRKEKQGWIAVLPGIVLVLLLTGWVATPPRMAGPLFYMLPNAPDAYEARFFSNWEPVLRYVGIPATKANSLDDVPPGAVLVLPWLTAPFSSAEIDPVISALGDVARAKGLTVVLAGEHTDYGGVRQRINSVVNGLSLRDDLTTPALNGDQSGPLRAADGQAWPMDALLNRGASVEVQSPFGRVLLAGDGWWAEPNLGEWLWVGDYVWSPGDRHGRLNLASAVDDGAARWVVVGDNSLLVDRQLIADPRPLIRLLGLTTLWPAFLSDAALVFGGLALGVGFRRRMKWSGRRDVGPAIVISMILPVAVAAMVEYKPSAGWRSSFVSASSFDERGISEALAGEPRLTTSGWTFSVHRMARSGSWSPPARTVEFVLVGGSAQIGGVNVSECARLGSLDVNDGVRLMDAQACRLDGKAEVLIGTQSSAAAFAVMAPEGPQVVVLDPAFLAARAPVANRTWLAQVIERIGGKKP